MVRATPLIEYSTNDAGYHVPLAEYLQQAWGDLGITLTINKMEWSSFTACSSCRRVRCCP